MNSEEFLVAASTVNNLANKPNNDELSTLYGLYKQATLGDNNTPKPSFINIKDSTKWNSWNAVRGLSKYDSEVKYIIFVNNLIQKYGLK